MSCLATLPPPPSLTTVRSPSSLSPRESEERAEVMVIDPCSAFRDVLSEYLTLEGYDPICFGTVVDAIRSVYFDLVRVYLRTRPVAILLDFPEERAAQEEVVSLLTRVFIPLHIPLLMMSDLPYPDLCAALAQWDLSHMQAAQKMEGVAHIVETMQQHLAPHQTVRESVLTALLERAEQAS